MCISYVCQRCGISSSLLVCEACTENEEAVKEKYANLFKLVADWRDEGSTLLKCARDLERMIWRNENEAHPNQ